MKKIINISVLSIVIFFILSCHDNNNNSLSVNLKNINAFEKQITDLKKTIDFQN